MLKLILENTEIDLYENESVNLTLQFNDVADINASRASFSQSFRVPATKGNLEFFGYINEPSAVDVKNLKQKIPAEILSGTTPVIRGCCQVKAVYIQKQRYADIELVFFGETLDLKTDIGDGMLSDLDLSDYDHDLTLQNVVNSWTTAVGIAPEVRYGLIDKGFNYSFPDNPPWTPTDGIRRSELTPFIKVKTIFDAIMDEAGYTYDSSFFDETGEGTMEDMYMPAYNGAQQPVSTDTFPSTVQAGLVSDIQSDNATLAILPIVDTVSNGVDDGGNFDNSTHKFTAAANGQYKITMNWSYTYDDTPDVGDLELYLYGNFVDASGEAELLQLQTDASVGFFGLQLELILGLKDGDELYYRYTFLSASGDDNFIEANNAWNNNGTGLQVEFLNSYEIIPIDVAGNMPTIKKIDFVSGLQKMFNLVFIPDKVTPKHFLIEPFTDYFDTGTQKDWTNLIDYDKDITIKPTTDIQAKQYEWSYLPGKDFISDEVQKSLDRVYGRYRITEPNNDFAAQEKKVEAPFGQYMTSLIPGSSFPIHRSIQSDGAIIKDPLPMVAYWHGVSDIFGQWYIRDDDGDTTGPESFFPSFSNYSDYEVDITGHDINYGMEQPLIGTTCSPWRTLFFEYWAQYVEELYSDEARILTCYARLSKTDIANFEFSDKIFIKDAYYRVLKMSYDANVEGLVQLELIKILSDVSLCDDVPTSYDSKHNFILFNDSDIDDIDIGSKACCELYGYSWLKVNQVIEGVGYVNLCKPKQNLAAPTNP